MRPGCNTGLVLRKGAWTAEEDLLLKNYIQKHGEGKWHLVPLKAGLNRCRKSCRLRWVNYLRPNIKRGDFNEDEVDLMHRLHKLLGNRWSLIAGRIPGRTANDVKNYWNTHVRSHPKRQKEELKDGKRSQHEMVSVIKPRPHTFSKTLNMYPHIERVNMGTLTTSSDDGFNDYLRLGSSPIMSNGKINEYLDELFEDFGEKKDDQVRWPLHGVTHVEGEGLDHVVEQEDGENFLCDFTTDNVLWDLLGS